MASKKTAAPDPTVARNKRASHEYHLESRYEAGLVLAGWELKSIRAGKAQLTDSYVLVRDGEAFLLGANITPLQSASTHVIADPKRTRKLLLHAKELAELYMSTQQKGYTCVALRLYWKNRHVKCEIALAKGKQSHDKRESSREKDWARQKERIMKSHHR